MLLQIAVVVSSGKLALDRVAALEASALQSMGSATLRAVLYTGAGLGLSAFVLIAVLGSNGPLASLVCWLVLIIIVALMASATLPLRSARRATLEVAKSTSGRQQEDAQIAAQILQQQIYGMLACFGSTIATFFVDSFVSGLLWPIPQPGPQLDLWFHSIFGY